MKRIPQIMLLGLFLFLISASACRPESKYTGDRAALVRAIETEVRGTSEYLGRSALDKRVMTALGTVPRHEFVPEFLRHMAYEDIPLPIGHGQTISQPYIVAIMTDLLNLGKNAVVLEVGTGSGYQAAILAKVVEKVYTIEIVEPLGEKARDLLKRLQYDNVSVRIGDGYYGWAEHAPFDGIVVTAAGGHIPPPLVKQLKPGGRMVIPVGGKFAVQQLVVVEKDQAGEIRTRQILPVRFVPLTGQGTQ